MPEYEVIVIYEAGLSEEALEAQVESFKGFLTREGAELLEVQKWGKRRLAWEIKKKREGFYVLFRVKGKPTLPQAVDRQLKFSEVVLRYLPVKVKPPVRSREGKATPATAPAEAGGEGS
ncbi:MAG: 30S ribosomal protein S6 [Candidatus Methylomirabilales bacterium]